MMNYRTILSVMIFCLIPLLTLKAETGYISDQLQVWTRTGPSDEYKVKYQLMPGTKIEILQRNVETGYVEFNDENGRTAWIDEKLITPQKTAVKLLAEARQQIEALTQQGLQQSKKLEGQIQRLSPLASDNQTLETELAQLQNDFQQLKQKNQALSGRFYNEVFFSGGATIAVGFFIGYLFGRMGGNKRSSGWS